LFWTFFAHTVVHMSYATVLLYKLCSLKILINRPIKRDCHYSHSTLLLSRVTWCQSVDWELVSQVLWCIKPLV